MTKNSLDHQLAVVTGGTRGIGRAMTELFLDCGARVLFTGRSNKAPFEHERARYLPLDFLDKENVCEAVRVMTVDSINILVNNAGINMIEPIYDLDENHWDKILDVNLRGSARLLKAVSRKMINDRIAGRILNIGSIFGVISKEKRASYSSSKAGLLGLTRAAALDLAPYGILVNALSPGFTDTELTRQVLGKKGMEELSAKVPLRRCADVSEIARWALFLCSSQNTYITGQNVIVDGGFTIQ